MMQQGVVVGNSSMQTNPQRGGGSSLGDALAQHGITAADIELASSTAKPSNVLLGIVFALSLLSFGFSVGGTSSTMWSDTNKGWQAGLAEACKHYTTTTSVNADGEATADCFEDEDDILSAPKVKGPARFAICRRWGIKPENEVTLKVPGEIDVKCFKSKHVDDAKDKYDYFYQQTKDGDEKGAAIVMLGISLAVSVVSNLLHFILVVTCAVVAIVGFLHNCLPTGKLPPIVPIISASIGVAVAGICCVAQAALFVFFMGGPGTTWNHKYKIGFYVAWCVLAIDVAIIAVYVMRVELRVRGCCAGRAHCCAKCC
jgi:hypothetical protein